MFLLTVIDVYNFRIAHVRIEHSYENVVKNIEYSKKKFQNNPRWEYYITELGYFECGPTKEYKRESKRRELPPADVSID